MLSSDSDDLDLNTGDLVTQDLNEYERSSSFGFNGSFDSSGSGFGFGNSNDTGGSDFGVTGLGGNYSSSALDGTTSATVGGGNITIRNVNEEEAAELLSSLNRDTDDVTNITRDDSFRTGEVFVDIKAAIETEERIRTIHYRRNERNIESPTIADLDSDENGHLGFEQLPRRESRYHRQGRDAEGNIKYQSGDGHYEAVYDTIGNLVTDYVNQGTYNFGTNPITHFAFDMLTYFVYGNSPNDPTKWYQRPLGTYRGDADGE